MSDEAFIVTVDRDVCIGSGSCVVYAPGSFEQDAEAKAVPIVPAGDGIETIRIAVEACPTHALALIETGS